MTEIICAGFGGQGTLVAGLILADAAMEQGMRVTWFPSYGAEMRGGTANCSLKISDEEIGSPYCEELDILLAMNDASITRFEKSIKPGGILVVNTSMAASGRVYRSDITVVPVAATDLALEQDNPRGLNVVMLGALAAHASLFEHDYLRSAVDHYFLKKGKRNAKNGGCFDAGFDSQQRNSSRS
ncbi:MAG: 2-oxoacid:acceptor oxidoreductase family protein [Oscillospiraceae bacterium]|nr:2-oxoacid:acceptor oxidoreductase family protein [Oscillospiraceae bacterium]